jgi:ribonuclease E
LQVLRALEEQLMKGATHNLIARTRPEVALYVLNQKRAHLRGLEERFRITITITADESVTAPQAFVIDRGEQVHTVEAAKALAEQAGPATAPLEEEDDLEEAGADTEPGEVATEEVAAPEGELGEQGGNGRGRRRRRRGRRGEAPVRDNAPQPAIERGAESGHDASEGEEAADEAGAEPATANFAPAENGGPQGEGGEPRRRRRGRRGGRRNRRDREGEPPENAFEPELTQAVADLDTSPAEIEPMHREPPPPAAAPQALESSPPAAEAPPRRRSTVREPAPIGGSETQAPMPPPSPEPSPVVVESGEAEAKNQPRKTGWWSRRIMGG